MDRGRGFVMSEAPLLRLALFQLGEKNYRLIWTFHHALMDDRGYTLVLREVFAYYEAFQRGKELELPRPRPYRDYIDWLNRIDGSMSADFWQKKLNGFTAPTPLVVDRPAGDERGPRQGDQEVFLSRGTTETLRSLARDHALTLHTFVQGAWAVLLSRYSGEDDVLFGAIGSSRSSLEGGETMVGMFWNTQPLRVRVHGEASLLQWLKELRGQWLAQRPHAHVPLPTIRSWSELPAGVALFESLLDFEDYHLDSAAVARRSVGESSLPLLRPTKLSADARRL